MADAKALALWLALATLASNPLQAAAKCTRKCIAPCTNKCVHMCVTAADARRRGQVHCSACFAEPLAWTPPPPPYPRCCVKNQTPCTFFATALNQNITINNACMVMWDATLPIQPWW